MNDETLEIFSSRQVGVLRISEETSRTHNCIGLRMYGLTVGTSKGQFPTRTFFIKASFFEIVLKANVGRDAVLLGNEFEIRTYICATRKIFFPRIIAFETKFICGTECVNSDIRVLVNTPGAANLMTPFINRVGDSKVTELDGSSDAIKSTTNNGHMKIFGNLVLSLWPKSKERMLLKGDHFAVQLELCITRICPKCYGHQFLDLFVGWLTQYKRIKPVIKDVDQKFFQLLFLQGI